VYPFFRQFGVMPCGNFELEMEKAKSVREIAAVHVTPQVINFFREIAKQTANMRQNGHPQTT
jgi:hypothetical protein